MIFLPLALFATQYWLYLQIIEQLKHRHMNTWVGLGTPSGVPFDTIEVTPEFLAEKSLAHFLLKGPVTKLKDNRLTWLVRAWRLLGILALVGLIVVLVTRVGL